jgi:hypothetical protein
MTMRGLRAILVVRQESRAPPLSPSAVSVRADRLVEHRAPLDLAKEAP